jgi:cation diffusion facilitator CzcD-associated flavoprotein CzcO
VKERLEVDLESDQSKSPNFDAIVIGAGVSGLYALCRLRELGLRVRAFESGEGVGGVKPGGLSISAVTDACFVDTRFDYANC